MRACRDEERERRGESEEEAHRQKLPPSWIEPGPTRAVVVRDFALITKSVTLVTAAMPKMTRPTLARVRLHLSGGASKWRKPWELLHLSRKCGTSA